MDKQAAFTHFRTALNEELVDDPALITSLDDLNGFAMRFCFYLLDTQEVDVLAGWKNSPLNATDDVITAYAQRLTEEGKQSTLRTSTQWSHQWANELWKSA